MRRDFDSLVAFDKLKNELLAYEFQIMVSLFEHTETPLVEDKVLLFRNSLRVKWIECLEEKYPILISASNFGLEQHEAALQESIGEKRSISSAILQLRLREKSYENIEFNRLQNRVTYRDLFHQVSKKKRLWPLRKIIQEYRHEIFDLLPCWMVSPESASALFPMDVVFDLVIFDEASQCFAEQGLPSMYRGKQVVIAGDSKQLKPNDLYQARWEDETDDTPDLEIESLLDLTSKYLPTVQLKNHYRSRKLDLIDFSNTHFYNHSLELIPYFSEINNQDPSINYISVKGVWQHNTNREEALKVVELVVASLKLDRTKSIGVITFNFKQAALIVDLLEAYTVAHGILLPEGLFVKNIENVQGDEKDIIIFSIGYAPSVNGRFTMQFGSLSQDGGENRLNVAITRAKDKVYVVASILPQQLVVEGSLNEGPRMLKKYLEYSWQVSSGMYKPSKSIPSKQNRDWYLSKKILESVASSDYNFNEELPFADLTVQNAGKYYSLIFTDDDLYFTARNPKEIHAYKPLELKEKGWLCSRFFSREHWLQKNDYLPIKSPDL